MSPNDKNNLNKKNDGPWQIKKIAVGLHHFFLKKKKKIYWPIFVFCEKIVKVFFFLG